MSRIRANQITNQSADGAPTVQNGLVITGVCTATSFSGIDADKISEGNTEVETVDTGIDGHVKFTLEGDEKARIAGVGSFGLGETAPVCSFDASSKSDAIQVPNGTTGERPSGISAAHSYGMIRYNETLGLIEKYDSNGWSVCLLYTSPSPRDS